MILNNDNGENREQIEYCYKQRKTVFNPIIDWTTAEVWEFIREYNVPYCSLYDEGHTRLGCVGCPMSTRQATELERWPGFKKLYLNAFAKMLKRREEAGKETEWRTPRGCNAMVGQMKAGGQKMNIGTAAAIFCRINDSDISYKDKIAAIGVVINMETHNSITKAQILEALRWLYSNALPGNNYRN